MHNWRMRHLFIVLLVSIIILALASKYYYDWFLREGLGKNQTVYSSFGQRYQSVDNTYRSLDAANFKKNSEKAVGPNVTSSITDPNFTLQDDNGPKYDFNNLDNTGGSLADFNDASSPSGSQNYSRGRNIDFNIFATDYNRSHEPGGKNRDTSYPIASGGSLFGSRSFSDSSSTVCESINGFLLREIAITNIMATQFTAEQKLQMNSFMSALNNYMKKVRLSSPEVAANWVQSSGLTRTSLVDTVVAYARQQASNDKDAGNLVSMYEPVQSNATMLSYVLTMLVTSDLSDAYHDCNGSIIR